MIAFGFQDWAFYLGIALPRPLKLHKASCFWVVELFWSCRLKLLVNMYLRYCNISRFPHLIPFFRLDLCCILNFIVCSECS
ncbi:hypothetical protein RchiOBHm_Chr6g0272321 [Rosa chinensis]|uniref:Uncharacterized protein n=1 Tax=Rosa chinensis TaxID=74649 RepID=A0A2P6PR72_ROSCH|nr:hypothetical protein RchiOBHm_Chr6g0272321 [Rosa chinensis]